MVAKVEMHRLAEERSLALHRTIAERLDESDVLGRARARVQRWRETGEVASYWAEEWARVLSGTDEEIRAFLVAPGERARAMRQVTPFAGAINPRTRWRIWREVRERMASAS